MIKWIAIGVLAALAFLIAQNKLSESAQTNLVKIMLVCLLLSGLGVVFYELIR
ncbi:hypothetical protein NF212_10310 [Parasalinivibrio latis]|uniref:hypothetical protein n=1 Tax=Parasalinivibrio latis TaxID=2952610 RepID=UPI0030E20827